MGAMAAKKRISKNRNTPTVKDVAEKAGVSTATVSRVVSGGENVSQHLIAQVKQAIVELNYRPSRVARNLRVRKANTVGLIVSDIQNPFFTSIMRGIQDTLQVEGIVLLAANSDEDVEQERIHLETLLAEDVAGIILAPASSDSCTYADILAEGIGIVVIDRNPKNLKVDSVLVDNVSGARAATEHLISLGHERIGIITGPKHISTSQLRLEGYQSALQDAGIPFDPSLVGMGNFRQEGGYQVMQALCSLMNPPTAVFSSNNVMTLGALQAIHEKCLRIPSDIALVSFDDMPWAASLHPPLTAVAQPTYEIGTAAARLLLDRVKEPDRPTRKIILESQLIIRGSTVVPDYD
jgi:DNA-binding LacI/PurR family transcriptional regulator